MTALLQTDLPGLHLLSRGKVRDVYAISSSDHLLFIATDRISVYDVVLKSVRSRHLNAFLPDFMAPVFRVFQTRADCLQVSRYSGFRS